MRTVTVKIDADDTPKSIAYLLTLATAIPQTTDANSALPTSAIGRKLTHVIGFKIYAESTNNIDASNGPARIGFENTNTQASFTTSRVAATANGIPLLPGIAVDYQPSGAAASYDFRTTAISGKTSDIFQISFAD